MASLVSKKGKKQGRSNKKARNRKANLYLAAHHIARLCRDDELFNVALLVEECYGGKSAGLLEISESLFTCDSAEKVSSILQSISEYFDSMATAVKESLQ